VPQQLLETYSENQTDGECWYTNGALRTKALSENYSESCAK